MYETKEPAHQYYTPCVSELISFLPDIRPAQIAESVNDSANSSLVMG